MSERQRKVAPLGDVYESPQMKAMAAKCCDCRAEITLSAWCVATAFYANRAIKQLKLGDPLSKNEVARCVECHDKYIRIREREGQRAHDRFMAMMGDIRDAMRGGDEGGAQRAFGRIPKHLREEHEEYITAVMRGDWLLTERRRGRE